MTLTELLWALRNRGLRLESRGDRLAVIGPSEALTPELRAALKEHREALLAVAGEGHPETVYPPLVRMDDATPAPLSYAQERVWLAQLLDPEGTAYQMVVAIRIGGPLDGDRMERALRSAWSIHEALRTRVEVHEGRPVQVVDDGAMGFCKVKDPGGDLAQWVAEAQRRPIDLAVEHPFRALLVKLDPESYGLVLTFHHVAIDGVSILTFFDDVGRAYGGTPLEESVVRYQDFARWEREVVAEATAELDFWRDYLDGAPLLLDLPVDRPRPARQTFTGARLVRVVDGPALEALRVLLASERSTLFMGLLAATAAAIHRQSGQRDLVLGTPVTRRVRGELARVVGMFADQLPLRVRVGSGVTLRKLLQDARERAVAAFRHQGVPFSRLLEGLDVKRSESATPLFQAMVNVLPALDSEAESVEDAGVRFSLPSASNLQNAFDEQSKFDFTLYAQDRGEAVGLTLVYNRDLYAVERMEQLLDDVVALLAAAERPDVPIDAVLAAPVASGTPLHALPAETVPARFAAVVEQHGDRTALVSTDGSRTRYRELAAEVESLAGRLVALGVPAGAPVGILLQHAPAAASAILAVLQAGHPYVPLDRRAPRERLAWMRANAGIEALIVDEATVELGRELLGSEGRLLRVGGEPAGAGSDPSWTRPGPDDLAYLLYTSGSTGRPKAVRQSHANLVVQADRYGEALDVTPDDRLALLASISFDAHLMDLFGALLRGASILFVDLDQVDLSRLPDQVRTHGVKVLHTTPTVFRTLLRATPGAKWDGVRGVVLGGEAVRAGDVQAFDAAFAPEARLYNLYGASEHSFAVGGWLDRSLHARTTEVPLGRPVGDVEAVLLDEDGRPDSVQGVLALRSAHGALGYHDQADLEAAAWIADPERAGERIYRTGDRVRRRPDGQLVFLRRADDQLKVRGHRIEPAEVEATLEKHPAVLEAGVHGPIDETGERVLVACVVPRPGRVLDPSPLIEWCRERLPRALVPTRWTVLDYLPRTVSGKIDRRRLPLPAAPEVETSSRAPTTPTERAVAALWAEVLGREAVGADDDFFAVGGHSLLAVQVMARIRTEFGVDVPLRQLFDHPTVAHTATWLDAHRHLTSSRPPLVATGAAERPSPLSFSQERMWFLQEVDPEGTAYNLGAAVLALGPLDLDRLGAAFREIGRRHTVLRSRYALVDGQLLQSITPGLDLDLVVREEVGDGSDVAVQRAADWISGQLYAPYDLSGDPLARLAVVRVGPDLHAFGVGMHHIAGDAVSMQLLAGEITAFYDELDAPLPESPIQYADFALWQKSWLTEGLIKEKVDIWARRLAGVSTLDLATDRPWPKVFNGRGGRWEAELEAALYDALRDHAAREGVTPFAVMMAAFEVMLHSYSRQTDLAVGVPVAHRDELAAEQLIGTFVNTVVVRTDLGDDPSFVDLVGRVRDETLEAMEHAELPFEVLVRHLAEGRQASRPPLVQVFFNVVHGAERPTEVVGQKPTPLRLGRDATQFELGVAASLQDDRARLSFSYATSLFDASTVEAMAGHFIQILERGLAEPSLRVSELREASSEERARLRGWGRGASSSAGGADFVPVVDQVASRAAADPARVAVRSAEGEYRYGELMARAGAVTAALQAVGVGRGDRVAVLVERGHEMVAALLGVLGAGAAYVPVDPGFPESRVELMLDDSGAAALLTHRGLEQELAGSVPVVDLDAVETVSGAATVRFVTPAPEDPAYVIYTSGSTGTPKGVVLPHRAMVNFLASMAHTPGFGADDVLLAVTTISFDISVLELFLPLVQGGRLFVTSDREASNGRALARRMESEGVTVLQATPATWKLLLAAGWEGRPELRALTGGEPLPPDLAARLVERAGEVWNLYGPTETTVWSTVARIEAGDVITVGGPIDETWLRVVDAEGREVPAGVPGELWIGGAGVALGYHNRPELTADRFVEREMEDLVERFYRTGDLVRWRGDGRLEHLGRMDDQVKVRGFRIELGEVESVLRALPGVADVACAARDDRLIAWFVAEESRTPSLAEFRAWIRDRLPAYMMPSLFVPIDEIPLTPNGKVDRRLLPDPAAQVPQGTTYEPPQGPLEELLAEIWSELLEVERVGAGDYFFELGGHSLLAMQAVAEFEERSAHRLEPRALFFSNVRQLAASAEPLAMEHP